MAAYNAEATIRKTLDSLLHQVDPPDEIIVCDDGSTDNTGCALRGEYPQVRLLQQKNAGQAAALNRLVGASSSSWIMIVDADDWIHPDRVAKTRARIDEVNAKTDIITTDAFVVNEAGHISHRYYEAVRWIEEAGAQRRSILQGNFMFGAAAIRRGAWLRVKGMRESLRLGQDYDLWIRMLRSGSVATLINEPLYYYLRHPSATSADVMTVLRGTAQVWRHALEEQALTDAERAALRSAVRANELQAAWLRVESEQRARSAPRRTSLLHLASLNPTSKAGLKATFAALTAPRLWSTASGTRRGDRC